MVRKQVYITKRQENFLKDESQSKGMTQAEIIRRALDRFIDLKKTIKMQI